MAIINAPHSASPIELLGRKKPSSRYMRYGAEVETGWPSQRDKEAYHNSLSDVGLDSLVISKADGSIQSSYGSEIVTVPLKLEELVDTVGRVGDAFGAQGMKAQIGGCGVHVHISAGPLSDAARYRTMAALMFDKYTWQRCNTAAPEDALMRVRELNEFWDLVSLRTASEYSQRISLDKASMLRNSQHSYAAIKGHNKPTIEIRAFKTCRSGKVLRSYPEVAASLAAFASSPIAVPEAVERQDRYDMANFSMYLLHNYGLEFLTNFENLLLIFNAGTAFEWAHEAARAVRTLQTPQGHSFTRCGPGICSNYQEHASQRMEAFCVVINMPPVQASAVLNNIVWRGPQTNLNDRGMSVAEIKAIFDWVTSRLANHCDVNDTSVGRVILPVFNEDDERLISVRANSRQYVREALLPYEGGLLPVREYVNFVLDHRSLYPHFAERLELKRFEAFRNPSVLVTVPEFNTTEPHDELQVGCKVIHQYDQDQNERVVTGVSPKTYNCTTDAYGQELVHHFFHVCEGASRLESWAE